ncbi:hypothetical protein WS53_15965 [Burkholderia territorii]|nr:hypothetical protein WS53_15965 [Burkholderia territorii]
MTFLEDVPGLDVGRVDVTLTESVGDIQRSHVRTVMLLLTHQLSHLFIKRFSVCAGVFRKVQSPVAVRANGDCIRHRIRSAICELAEVMNFEKRTICP